MVLPRLPTLAVVIHELGHVLDESLGFRQIVNPVTEYAKINRREAFAEAFTTLFFWNYGNEIDEGTRAFLEGLQWTLKVVSLTAI